MSDGPGGVSAAKVNPARRIRRAGFTFAAPAPDGSGQGGHFATREQLGVARAATAPHAAHTPHAARAPPHPAPGSPEPVFRAVLPKPIRHNMWGWRRAEDPVYGAGAGSPRQCRPPDVGAPRHRGGEARGNPVRPRDCPAAVFGNDRRQQHWVQPAPGKRRPVGTRPAPAGCLGDEDARESEDLPAPARKPGWNVEPRGTACGRVDPGTRTVPLEGQRSARGAPHRCTMPCAHPGRCGRAPSR